MNCIHKILIVFFIYNLNMIAMSCDFIETAQETKECVNDSLAWESYHDFNYIFEQDPRVKFSHVSISDRLFASNNQLVVFDLSSKKIKFLFNIENIICARFSDDQLKIVVVSGSNYITVFDRNYGSIIEDFCLCDTSKLKDGLTKYPELLKFSDVRDYLASINFQIKEEIGKFVLVD